MIAKRNIKVLANLNKKILNLREIKIFQMEVIIKKNVIVLHFAQLFMKCIFKKYSNLHYHHWKINDVMKKFLKVNLGILIR